MEQEQRQRPAEDWARELADVLRRGLPRELDGQFNALLRELLLTLRSLIDWYLERLDRAERRPEVEEIPID